MNLTIASTNLLLKMLVAFIEMQIIAVQAKHKGLSTNPISYPIKTARPKFIPKNWSLIHGICSNLAKTKSKLVTSREQCQLLEYLFKHCPSGTKSGICPVKAADGVDYPSNIPNQFWGDHPYADNQRKIIEECIDQLHEELKSRGYDVG